MRKTILLFFLLISLSSAAQKTWYGDIAFFAGGGSNDIFRYEEPVGAASFTGNGYWTAGIDFRRIITKHFSIETGLGYAHQYYIRHSAPMPETTETPGNFGVLTVPFTARLDFLKYFFIEGGLLAGLQAGSSMADDMTGLGLTVGGGLRYQFKNDVFVSLRAYANQNAMLHFMPEDNPQMLWESGLRLSVGYQFIRLGKCHCPDDNSPKKGFF